MYQEHNKNKRPKSEFQALIKAFEEHIYSQPLDIGPKEWDLSKSYFPNWACMWNSPKNIDEECVIVQKDDKLALVQFKSPNLNTDIIANIYRLEDLTLKNN